MKKMINLFKLIFNAFDRYIIMPITRLVFKISQIFSKRLLPSGRNLRIKQRK